ncbi:hypothetical protein ACHAWO_009340 [Cyclotella atomus]|uniref:Uncharacterized protein n=1 Tax=Cyclotella atomus TaxID=382360 RepID=A0ABD3P6D1_9STRA
MSEINECGYEEDNDEVLSDTYAPLLPFFKNNVNLIHLKINSFWNRWISENAIVALCACPSLKTISILSGQWTI